MKKSYFFLCYLFLCCSYISAQRVASVSGPWSSTATWGGAAVPTSADIVQINPSITVTVDVNAQCANLNFLGTGVGTEGILQFTSSSALTLAVNGNINMAGANQAGRITSNNANHIITVTGNITASTGGGTSSFQMTTGTVRLVGTGTAIISMSAGNLLNLLEIGDGTNAKTANFTGAGPVRFGAGGKLIVTNAAIFNAQNAAATVLNSGGSTTASLIVRNGGAFYANTASAATTNDVLANFTTVNSGEADANINTGIIQLTPPTAAAATFSIPAGTYGNLYFRRVGAATGTSATTVDVVGSASPVTVKVLGDFNAYSVAGAGASGAGNYFFRGSSTAANRANVTWEFAGVNKDIVIDRAGRIIFGNTTFGTDASTESKVVMSGSIRLDIFNNTTNATASPGRLWIHDWTVNNGASFVLKTGITAPAAGTQAYGVSAMGNLIIGPSANATVDLTGLGAQQLQFFADETRAAATGSTWSGQGSLTVRTFKQANSGVVITSTLNNIAVNVGGLTNTQISAAPISNVLVFGTMTFTQTSGTFTIENSTAPTDWTPLAGGGSTNIRLNNLIIKANTLIDFSYGYPIFQLNGNVIFETGAGWQTNNAATGSAVIEFAGTSAQTFTTDVPNYNNAQKVNFQKVRINNANGLTLNGTMFIGRDQGSIGSQTLDLTSGTINTSSANELIILPTVVISNTSNSSFVNGPARYYENYKPTALGASVQTATAITFPSGKGTTLGRIGVIAIAGLDPTPTAGNGEYFDAEYFTGTSSNSLGPASTPSGIVSNPNGYTPPMVYASRREYWILSKGSTAATNNAQGKVKLFYENNLFSDLSNKGSDYLRVAHWTGSSWTDEGNDNSNTTEAAGASGSINSAISITTFSPFALGTTNSALNPLPMRVVTFNATKKSGHNLLHFEADCSTDYGVFEIQRSTDGRDFKTVQEFTATKERCKQPFDIKDESFRKLKNYYRIKMTDANGTVTYSFVALVNNGGNGIEIVNLQPTVTANHITLSASSYVKDKMELVITSFDGKVMQRRYIQLAEGTNQLQMDISAFPAGMYQLRGVTGQGVTNTMRFIKQ